VYVLPTGRLFSRIAQERPNKKFDRPNKSTADFEQKGPSNAIKKFKFTKEPDLILGGQIFR
jgi:hypothetical protein